MNQVIALLLIVASLLSVDAKVVEGGISLSKTKPLQYISKFSFATGVSEFKLVSPNYRADQSGVKLYLLCDEELIKWNAAPTCAEKVKLPRVVLDFSTSTPSADGLFELTTPLSQSIRTHVWYAFVGDCGLETVDTPQGKAQLGRVYFRYIATFLNPGGNQMGADMYGMFTLNFLMLLFTSVLGAYFGKLLAEHNKRFGFIHPLVMFLGVSLILQWLSLLCEVLHLASYSYNGVGVSFLAAMHKVFSLSMQLGVSALLMVLAGGYTLGKLSFSTMSDDTKVVILLVSSLLFISHLGLAILGYVFHDAMDTFHAGETLPGYIIIFLRLILLGGFWIGLTKSLSEKNITGDVQNFLVQFRTIGSAWFLVLPVTTIIGFVFAPYLRHQFVEFVSLIAQVITLVILTRLFLTQSAYTKISSMNASLLPGSSSKYS